MYQATQESSTKSAKVYFCFSGFEEIKRELQRILIYECVCHGFYYDLAECRRTERLKAKAEGSTRLTYTEMSNRSKKVNERT
jgi:hypothetical protein